MILALDLSSTSTGVCLDGDTFIIAPKGNLLERAREMREEIKHYLIPAPDLVVAEAIGTRHVQTAIAIATVHALVLDEVVGYCPLLVVSPAQVKKFATSKGNANKDAMLVAGIREGSTAETNDEMDAWWLWVLGAAHLDGEWRVLDHAYRRSVVAGLVA